jgi:hypothetical protein
MEQECRVSIEGQSGIRHVLTLRAKSVFHAAGKALQTFRASSSTAGLGNDAACLTVETEGRSYRVTTKRVDAWVPLAAVLQSTPGRWNFGQGIPGDDEAGPLPRAQRLSEGACSRRTSRGFLSLRRLTKRVCRRWLSPVHSRNSNCPTSSGLSHRQSAILALVRPWPHRPPFASGRLAKGHSFVSRPRNRLDNCARDAGVNPLRVRAA